MVFISKENSEHFLLSVSNFEPLADLVKAGTKNMVQQSLPQNHVIQSQMQPQQQSALRIPQQVLASTFMSNPSVVKCCFEAWTEMWSHPIRAYTKLLIHDALMITLIKHNLFQHAFVFAISVNRYLGLLILS